MNELRHKIIRAVYRSQLAYGFYCENKLYHNALKIYKANQIVYDLLNEYIYRCDDEILDLVTMYIFHLEDWFEQFNDLELNLPKLEASFIFERLKDSPPFPKNFLKLINNNKL